MYYVIYLIIYYALSIKVKLPLQKLYDYNYNNRLYLKWLKKHLRKAFNHFDIYAGLLTIISFYVDSKLKTVLLILSIILMIYDTENIKYNLMIDKDDIDIPKENRIIRLLFIYIIIMILPFILGLIYINYKVFYIGLGILFLVFSYFFICLLNIILLPLESLIKKIVISNIKKKIKKLKINFIGILGKYGKSSLANILDQLIDSKTYVINNLDELYKIKFSNNDYVIVKINCIDENIKNIYFENVLCTREFNEEDLSLLKEIKKKNIYFYKQNLYSKQINDNNIYYYGDKDALINLVDYKINKNKINFSYQYHNKISKENINILGIYNIYHILISILLLDNLKIDYHHKISELKNLTHCLNIKELNGFTMIDNTYHSNFYSFKEGLYVLNSMKGTKIIVTPGLNDNLEIISKDIAKICDYVILIGEVNTKLLYELLIENKFNKNNIYITNDVYESYALISNLDINDNIYALYENNLLDLYKE